MPYNRATLLTF